MNFFIKLQKFKDFNFFFEENEDIKNEEKNGTKRHASSFSHPLKTKDPMNCTSTFKTFSTTHSLFSKSVSRESLKENEKKKNEENNKNKIFFESPFFIDFNVLESNQNEVS